MTSNKNENISLERTYQHLILYLYSVCRKWLATLKEPGVECHNCKHWHDHEDAPFKKSEEKAKFRENVDHIELNLAKNWENTKNYYVNVKNRLKIEKWSGDEPPTEP